MRVFAVDQSQRGTGLCLLDDLAESPVPVVLTRVDTSSLVGFDRIVAVRDRLVSVLDTYQPDLFVLENYAFSQNSSSSAAQCELGGVVKMLASDRGYRFGWGTGSSKDTRAVAQANTKLGPPLFVMQTSSNMKKFMLRSGASKKDTSYLLTVYKKTGVEFNNDDEADAWMHASMAGIIYGVINGTISLSSFDRVQIEALITRGVKATAKLTMAKAIKLPDHELTQLVGM